jgi:hypothetical protein
VRISQRGFDAHFTFATADSKEENDQKRKNIYLLSGLEHIAGPAFCQQLINFGSPLAGLTLMIDLGSDSLGRISFYAYYFPVFQVI